MALEVAVLGALLARSGTAAVGAHGFELAREIASSEGARALTSHGTLYKALARLRNAGLVTARWEDADTALAAGRPRRRLYEITGAGQAAFAAAAEVSRHALPASTPRPLPA